MINEHIPLSVFYSSAAYQSDSVSIQAYAHESAQTIAAQSGRWAVLIMPGGGYRILAPSESEPVAMAFFNGGCQAFVLNYSLAPAKYPTQFLEAAAAIAYLRKNQSRYGFEHLAVCGLSAGGHLAGCIANLWDSTQLKDAFGSDTSLRPDAAILSYPVISAKTPKRSPAFDKLTGAGTEITGEYAPLSLEDSVTETNPPTFLWATVNDPQVSVEHTMKYAEALRVAGVPFELHLFQNGPHALSIATPESARSEEYCSPHVAHWLPLCLEWLHGEALR